MNDFNEILRYKSLGKSERFIAKALKTSRKTVKKYLEQAQNGAIGPINKTLKPPDWTLTIDWDSAFVDVSRGRSTLQVIWEEESTKGTCPIDYSGFWKQFHKRFPVLEATMHRVFNPGDRLEIDYCDGIDIIIPSTGEIITTHLFMGVLCHSRHAYAEFSLSQKSEDFLNSHVRMFEYFGGVPAVLSPDNLKSAVNKTHRYDPEINQAYTRLADHYGFVVAPARVRTPKDKAIVERTIQIFQRWFYSKVRNKTFTSLIELNNALTEDLKLFMKKKHRIFKMTREEMFNEERPHLKPLPDAPYVVATHKKAKQHSDCHIEFDKHYYSAPWNFRGKLLDVWATEKVIEIYHEGERIAFHGRIKGHRGKFATKNEHYPEQHQAYLEITPCSLRSTAKEYGASVYAVVDHLLNVDQPLGYVRRCQGILSLAKKYSKEDLNRASEEALRWNRFHVRYLEGVIRQQKRFLDEEPITRNTNPYFRGLKLYQ